MTPEEIMARGEPRARNNFGTGLAWVRHPFGVHAP
jgi:hypothetical protein